MKRLYHARAAAGEDFNCLCEHLFSLKHEQLVLAVAAICHVVQSQSNLMAKVQVRNTKPDLVCPIIGFYA